ncbi:MAG: hypothetical protein Kow0092_04770 [Deferrisomatales bacterium]
MWQTRHTGRTRVEQAIKQFLPPCQAQCPINEDIQRTNVLLSLLPDDEAEAREGVLQIGDYLWERNPLFTICGYVCGLCELGCNYSAKGGAIRRRLLKRFVADRYADHLPGKEEFDIVRSKEDVAVVGAGPAGLMAAFDLSKRGYRVTVFESSDRMGGALWLIPRYRLPEETLRGTLEQLVRIAGIDVKYNARVGEGRLTLERLRNDGYRAVFVARGTPTPRVLTFGREPVAGQELSGVMFGQTFLYEVSHGTMRPDYFRGQRVLVIGGGNVAFDVARTARRLGGDTTVVCLECEDKTSEDGIPADHEEIKGAWEEGIRIVYSRGVRRIRGEGGKFRGIDCPRCTGVFDETGFNPRFDLDDTVLLEGDVLVIAVGQGPDRAWMAREGLLDESGRLAVDPVTYQSRTRPWVFVGGDMRRIGFMAEAMRDGLEAAESMERYLRGLDLREGRTRDYEAQEIPLRRSYKHEPEVAWIPPEKRMHFQLFERGFTLSEAREEAKRCLTCGPCISCKACVSIGLQPELPTVVVHEERCSGCGVCTATCYYNSAHTKPLAGRMVSATDPFKCKACGMCVAACPADARELFGCDLEERFEQVLSAF